MPFPETLRRYPLVLTEGAVIERLRRDGSFPLDPHVLHAGFIYHADGRRALRQLYRQYLDIGQAADLPMLVGTPTWRANPIRLQNAGLADRDVNGDGVRFLASIRAEYDAYADRVWIGGLIGCRGDAYRPAEGLSRGEAAGFHASQVRALASAGADFLLAATLPNAGEAGGMALAMAATGLPYVVSFVVRRDGRLLDGTPLGEAVGAIDATVQPRPAWYMVNCVHPSVFEAALLSACNRQGGVGERVLGLQANASPKSPEDLEGLDHVDADPPEVLADAVLRVRRRLGTRILGGCCGTDHRHIEQIARRARDCARPIV